MTAKSVESGKRRYLARLVVLGLLALGCWQAWSWLVPGPVARGREAYRQGDWTTAARLAEQRLQTSRNDDEALRLMARASVRLGRFSEARGIYARLPGGRLDAEDNFLQGLSLARTGQFDAAQKAWRAVLELDPNHAETLSQLAQLALDRGQMVESRMTAERLARLPGWEVRGELLLGVSQAMAHDPEAASQALQRALDHDPQARLAPSVPFSTQKVLARMLLQTRRSDEAFNLIEAALAAGPDRELSWLLSRALLQQERAESARTALEAAGSYRSDFPMEPEPSPYAGAARCQECHRDIYQSTLASRHARTLVLGPDLATLPFPAGPVPDPHDSQVQHRFVRTGTNVELETRVEARVYRAVIDYAVGAPDRYSSLLGHDERGRPRVLRLSYHHGPENSGSGWDRTKNLQSQPATAEDFLGEPLLAAEGAGECLSCHTTTVRSIQEGKGPEAHDRGVGCERCHGPGELHLTAIRTKFADPAIAGPAHAAPAAINKLCASCHAQHFLAMPASRTDPAWARFPSSNLPWSRCFTESGGALHCVTCHDPHRDAETSPAYYEAKCLSCHASSRTPDRASASQAFRSPCPVSPARDCLRCHMPRVPYPQLHVSFTDHNIRVQEANSRDRK